MRVWPYLCLGGFTVLTRKGKWYLRLISRKDAEEVSRRQNEIDEAERVLKKERWRIKEMEEYLAVKRRKLVHYIDYVHVRDSEKAISKIMSEMAEHR